MKLAMLIAASALLLAPTLLAPLPAAEVNPRLGLRNLARMTYDPMVLVPGLDLRLCVADAAGVMPRSARQPRYFPEEMLGRISEATLIVYGLDGALLLTKQQAREPDQLGLCVEVPGESLAPASSTLPLGIIVEVLLKEWVTPLVTLETAERASRAPVALLLPAIQATRAPAPGQFGKYRPQFYIRGHSESGLPDRIIGPVALGGGRSLEICGSSAVPVPNDKLAFSYNYFSNSVRVQGWDIRRKEPVFDQLIQPQGIGGCLVLDVDSLADPGGVKPEDIVVVVLLYSEGGTGVPQEQLASATLRATGNGGVGIALLVPAVQAARE